MLSVTEVGARGDLWAGLGENQSWVPVLHCFVSQMLLSPKEGCGKGQNVPEKGVFFSLSPPGLYSYPQPVIFLVLASNVLLFLVKVG